MTSSKCNKCPKYGGKTEVKSSVTMSEIWKEKAEEFLKIQKRRFKDTGRIEAHKVEQYTLMLHAAEVTK
jgi:hypothetical protein